MKHLFHLVLALLAISTSTIAQKKIELGIVVRPASTTVRGNENLNDFTSVVKWSYGLQAIYGLGKKTAIHATLLYDLKGAYQSSTMIYSDDMDNTFTANIDLNTDFTYITLPLLFRGEIGSTFKLEYGVGFYVSYLLEQRTKTKVTIPTDTFVTDEEGSDQFKTLDGGASASIGIAIPLSDSFHLRAGLDGNFGLIDAPEKSYLGSSLFHQSLGLNCSLSYRFWH
jgi:hypothetical protein